MVKKITALSSSARPRRALPSRQLGGVEGPANSAVAIRGAVDVGLWREHHVVERLREHRRREKGHGPGVSVPTLTSS